MKYYLFSGIFLLFSQFVTGQMHDPYPMTTEFGNQLELSGLDIHDDKMYVVSEQCYYLFTFDLAKLSDTHPNHPLEKQVLNIDNSGVADVEAIALYEGLLFYTDESDNSIGVIDLECNENIPVLKPRHALPVRHSVNTGLEGLEIHADLGLLYVLQERNREEVQSTSRIIAYRIDSRRDSILLTYFCTLDIQMSNSQRYTGLALNDDQNALYLIRSSYVSGVGSYFIDKIDLDKDGHFLQKSYQAGNLLAYDLAPDKPRFSSSNLEGIAFWNNALFIVSDNIETASVECTAPGRNTYLFSYQLK